MACHVHLTSPSGKVPSRTTLAAMLCAVAAGTGCAASDSGSGAPLPVDLSTEETRAVLLAEQKLVAECMRARSFKYEVIPPVGDPTDSELRPPYGTEDVAKARSEGYGFDNEEDGHSRAPSPDPHKDTVPTDPNTIYVESLPAERRKKFASAMFGPLDAPQGSVTLPSGQEIGFPLTGCYSAARERLYGDVDRYMTVTTFVDNLGGEIARRVRGDERLIDTLNEWRDCMKRRGYRFKDPGQAIETALNQPTDERAIAVADATCARDTGLADLGKRMLRRYEREIYAEFDGRVLAYNEITEQGLANAETVLRD